MGFASFFQFLACFNFLGPTVTNLTYTYRNSDLPPSTGRPHSPTPVNEFFLTMCRLRLALREQDLANRFLISQSSVSRIVNTWINLIYYKFKEIPIWPSRERRLIILCPTALEACTRQHDASCHLFKCHLILQHSN